MILLYHGSGAWDFEILVPALAHDEWLKLTGHAVRLLEARGHARAAELLGEHPFELSSGSNTFGDEFDILHYSLGVEEYVRLEELLRHEPDATAYRLIARTVTELGHFVRFIAVLLDVAAAPELVSNPDPGMTTAAVERALRDAQELLHSSGPPSAVDRIHTALHGHVAAICERAGIAVDADASLTEVFKRLRTTHSSFKLFGTADNETRRLMNALATVVDSLNTLRNRASVAHPTDALLADPEAILAINAARTLLHYVDARVRDSDSRRLGSATRTVE